MSREDREMTHLDAETLAAFAEGRLKRSEIAVILPHLRECAQCTEDVEAVNAQQQRPRNVTIPLAAAAALVIVAGGAWMLRDRILPGPMDRLVALAPHDARTIETRLTGFAWAPYRGALRAETVTPSEDRMKLVGAAGEAVGEASRNPSAESQRTAGIALLLVDAPSDAITRLRDATQRAPMDASAWSDLAAALDEAAIRLQRPSLHPEALAAADRALRIDPDHAEASFNRAVVLEHLGLTGQARQAWERYLRIDPSSPWSNEARERLRRLPATTGESLFRKEQPRLESAARSGDTAVIDDIVRRFPEQSRAFGEAEYLGRWGADKDENALQVARALGDALARQSGESLLRDAVRAIDRSHSGAAGFSPPDVLARAHALYRQARIAYSRQRPAAAEPELRIAASLFASGNSPMSLVARYYAANTRFDQDDIDGARADLREILREADAHPQYLALAGQLRWQYALTAMIDGDWASALPLLEEARQKFAAAGERSSLGFIRNLQAMALVSLGRPDEAWAARIDAFSLLSAEGRNDRLPLSISSASHMELDAGRRDCAKALLQLEAESARQSGNDMLLATTLARDALVSSQEGDANAASRAAREALMVAQKMTDPALHRALVADASLAAGAAALDGDAGQARVHLTRAIDFYRESKQSFFLPQALLLRARSARRLGDDDGAARDIEEGVATIERHHVRVAGSVAGTDVLDTGAALAREAIRLYLERNDVTEAFAYAERRQLQFAGERGRTAVSLPDLQKLLAGTGSAVLVLTPLSKELAAIAVTADGAHATRTPFEPELLAERITRATEGDDDAAAALYAQLIRPSEQSLATVQRLVIVADGALQHVPFGALFDERAKQYLVDRWSVSLAQNATSLRATSAGTPPRTALAVTLPTGPMPVLRDANDELAGIASLYTQTLTIDPVDATFPAILERGQQADVIHIAGHTSSQPGAGELALFSSTSRISWREIASSRFEREPVVTLAACETLRRPDPRTRALSLGGGFLAAGARDVVGTLVPIPDRDARDLFAELHRQLAAGLPAPDALRRVQLDAIATNKPTAWRALAVLTRHVVR